MRTVPLVSRFLILAGLVFLEPAALYSEELPGSKGMGRIAGKVRMEGRFQRPPPLKVHKNLDFCGETVPDESLLAGRDGGLQNAVVILSSSSGRKPATPSSLVLDNRNCSFVPRVQVAPVGSELLLLNGDPILHNVHARIGSETLFNVGLPSWRRVSRRLDRTGIVIVDCDVLHTWMRAYIMVTSSSHFAVTDRDGDFSVAGVPAGSYEIDVWHERLGRRSGKATVGSSGDLRVDFVYRASP